MKQKLIEAILKYRIIGTNFKNPITFKSGIKSPIYCDFRKSSAYPADLLRYIIDLLVEKLACLGIDCVSGVPVGGLAYSTICAEHMTLPHCYVRPEATKKNHGLKNLIEGCSVSGKTIGLIEDLFSTGGSAITVAKILKEQGAKEVFMISIFSYEMKRMKKELAEAGYTEDKVSSLITVKEILPYLKKELTEENYESLENWVLDPEGWFERYKLEFDFGFLTQLRRSASETKSIICMGLDPVTEALPEGYKERGIEGFFEFFTGFAAEMKTKEVSPSMFKPNLPWWLKRDLPRTLEMKGTQYLGDTLDIIRDSFPGVPANIDCKSGDIGTSSAMWAEYIYKQWGAHAMTVHTYMGSDSVGPFITYCNPKEARGAYLLVKTTNKGAADLQLKKMLNGRFVYEEVAENVIGWANGKPGVGVVAAGNSLEELATLGRLFAGKDIPLLIPGVGKQGGSAKEVVQVLRETGFELSLARINLSSGLTHPWYKEGVSNPPINECIDMVVDTLANLNEQVGFEG